MNIAEPRKEQCKCPDCEGVATMFVVDIAGKARTVVNCPVCSAKKEEAAKARREASRADEVIEIMRKGGMDGAMQEKYLGGYGCPDEQHKSALAAAFDFADCDKADSPWLIFCGRTGTGKTHLALGVAIIVASQIKTVYYSKIINLMQRLRASFRNDAVESEQAIVLQMKRVHLLILDEFGLREHMTDYERAILDDILDARWVHKKKTIVVSNMPLKEMLATAGERIESRMADCGRIVNFTWDDYRKKTREGPHFHVI